MKDDVEFIHLQINLLLNFNTSIPAASWSMAWVCGRSLAGIMGLNTVGAVDVCCECCVLPGTVSLLARSLNQRIPTDCGVPECVHEASMRRPCPLEFWECGFESLCQHGCLSRV